MIIPKILWRNKDLPFSNYYLDLSDFLIDEAYGVLRQKTNLWDISERTQEIEKFIQLAIGLFKQEHLDSEKKAVVICGFVCKKNKIKNRLVSLQAYTQKRMSKCSVS